MNEIHFQIEIKKNIATQDGSKDFIFLALSPSPLPLASFWIHYYHDNPIVIVFAIAAVNRPLPLVSESPSMEMDVVMV